MAKMRKIPINFQQIEDSLLNKIKSVGVLKSEVDKTLEGLQIRDDLEDNDYIIVTKSTGETVKVLKSDIFINVTEQAVLDALGYVPADDAALAAKENASNKVTTFSATPSDTNYPSEKLVADYFKELAPAIIISSSDYVWNVEGTEATITVVASGGLGGLTYTLGSESNSTGVFIVTTADTYTVVVSDGLGNSESVDVAEPEVWYGVRFTTTQESPDGERVVSEEADMSLHATLPVQSLMRGCLLNDDGTVNYYLKSDDWSLRDDGVTPAVLDGTEGQVMVEVPEHYFNEYIEGGYRYTAISLTNFSNAVKVSKFYIGAYEAALHRTDLKLASVVNTSPDYRGGDNTAAYDGGSNTLLGKPATRIRRRFFRTYARNRVPIGENKTYWNIVPYTHHSHVYRLFEIEYATRYSKKEVNGVLTAEGFRQGGLGIGVTSVISGEWGNFNDANPFVPCGASNSLGNETGEFDYTATDFGGEGINRTFKVNRYRGIENPFGHIWKWLDGANFHNNHTEGTSKIYIIDDPEHYADDTQENARDAGNTFQANGRIQEMSLNDKVPTVSGGANETYYDGYVYHGYSAASTYYRIIFSLLSLVRNHL